MPKFLILLILSLFGACADITPKGAKVSLVESSGSLTDFQHIADKLKFKHDCQDLGIIHAKSSLFPPSYSVHENEIHAALRNRAAHLGANLVIANFYQKPITGIAMNCSEEVRANLPDDD